VSKNRDEFFRVNTPIKKSLGLTGQIIGLQLRQPFLRFQTHFSTAKPAKIMKSLEAA
jgi:hypothetical protein